MDRKRVVNGLETDCERIGKGSEMGRKRIVLVADICSEEILGDLYDFFDEKFGNVKKMLYLCCRF